jgi:dephospho-CoA kinase
MRIIGLTGGIGSGKSEVRRILASMGYPCLDADRLAREILERPESVKQLNELFGPRILSAQNDLNRIALRDLIFSDAGARAKLESFLHPLIQDLFQQIVSPLLSERFDVWCFYEAALLVEKDRVGDFDRVVLVTSDWSLRKQRLVARGLLPEVSESVALAQMSDEAKLSKVNYEIRNNGDLRALRDEVVKFLMWLADEFTHS